MVCGVPLLVTAGTYMAELVERHGLGCVVEGNNVSALADALTSLIVSEEKRDNIIINSQKLRHDFLFDSYVEILKNEYRSLLF